MKEKKNKKTIGFQLRIQIDFFKERVIHIQKNFVQIVYMGLIRELQDLLQWKNTRRIVIHLMKVNL